MPVWRPNVWDASGYGRDRRLRRERVGTSVPALSQGSIRSRHAGSGRMCPTASRPYGPHGGASNADVDASVMPPIHFSFGARLSVRVVAVARDARSRSDVAGAP